MVKKLAAFTAVFAVLMFSCSCSAYAQVTCGPRNDVVKRLAEKYEEVQVAMGLSVTGKLVEIFVAEKGAFTILLSDANGTSCIATTGENWSTEGFIEVPGVGT